MRERDFRNLANVLKDLPDSAELYALKIECAGGRVILTLNEAKGKNLGVFAMLRMDV